MTIGVFDSGIGGQSVAEAIRKAMPDAQVKFVNDPEHLPYGTKPPDELFNLVKPILENLATKADVIVVACNTVSTTLIEKLREYIEVPLIAMEPMVKPAAETTKSRIIAVCATPTTLKSNRYKWLKETYANGITVLEPDCSDWASMIEENSVDKKKIYQRISDVCKQGADTIVLGCTHYHWIEKDIQEIADEFGAKVIQPEQAIIKQVKRVLEQP